MPHAARRPAAAICLAITAVAPALAQQPITRPGQADPQQQQQSPAPDVAIDADLTVSARAEVSVKPDRATVTVGVQTEAKDASDAQSAANERMQRIIERIRRLDPDELVLTTSSVSLYPVYDNSNLRRNDGGQERRITGYRAGSSISARTDDVDAVGPIVDTAIDAGANRVQGVTFSLSDPHAAEIRALRLASRRAIDKARSVADAIGAELMFVTSIGESTAGGGPIPVRGRAEAFGVAMDAGSSTPVEAGLITVTADVTVTARIAREP